MVITLKTIGILGPDYFYDFCYCCLLGIFVVVVVETESSYLARVGLQLVVTAPQMLTVTTPAFLVRVTLSAKSPKSPTKSSGFSFLFWN